MISLFFKAGILMDASLLTITGREQADAPVSAEKICGVKMHHSGQRKLCVVTKNTLS